MTTEEAEAAKSHTLEEGQEKEDIVTVAKQIFDID